MSESLIRRALETALKTYADGQSIDVAWENVEFTIPDDLYLRSFVLPARTSSGDLGRVNRRHEGIYQVSIVALTGDGPGAAETVVAGLSAAFDPATPLTAGGLNVWITDPLSRSAPIIERDRFVIPCSMPYASDFY